jgi:uncharacterized membrane protein
MVKIKVIVIVHGLRTSCLPGMFVSRIGTTKAPWIGILAGGYGGGYKLSGGGGL